MDHEKEPIIIDIPLLDEKSPEKEKKRLSLRAIPMAAAIFLLIFSLVMHSAIAVKACEYLKNEGSELLLSFIIPDYAISEPMVPPLPEESELQGNTEDKQFDFPIRESDLSAKAEYGLALTNETSYTPDLYYLLGRDRPSPTLSELDKKYGKDSPKVLIYHSHATEGYADSQKTSFRTHESEKNVVAVGEVISYVLKKAGIPTLHITELFDSENWNLAYDNSNAAVEKILTKYPSISYVFDIHRDCIGNDTDGYVRSTTTIEGKDAAQLMFVCGTDEGGSSHKDWRNNLSSAIKLQSKLYAAHPSLMRPVNLRRASFYQDTSPSSLILECGTCANTLDEAKRAAIAFAKSLADYITDKDCGLDLESLLDTLCP